MLACRKLLASLIASTALIDPFFYYSLSSLSFLFPASHALLKISLIGPSHLRELWKLFFLKILIAFSLGCTEKGVCGKIVI